MQPEAARTSPLPGEHGPEEQAKDPIEQAWVGEMKAKAA